ncbi:MAG: inorganic diphosphatase [Ectothiorhodospiraceae bacterium]
MNIDHIPAGKSVPDDINVIIEIPQNADPVKYEVDKDSGALIVDRFMFTAMHYPCNYGFVPHTLCGDGDPADVLVIAPFGLIPGSVVRCRPVGVLEMSDEAGEDAKIVAVPVSKLTPLYDRVQEPDDFPPMLKEQIGHFFEHYKDLEKGKWVRIDGWKGAEAARKELQDAVDRYAREG